MVHFPVVPLLFLLLWFGGGRRRGWSGGRPRPDAGPATARTADDTPTRAPSPPGPGWAAGGSGAGGGARWPRPGAGRSWPSARLASGVGPLRRVISVGSFFFAVVARGSADDLGGRRFGTAPLEAAGACGAAGAGPVPGGPRRAGPARHRRAARGGQVDAGARDVVAALGRRGLVPDGRLPPRRRRAGPARPALRKGAPETFDAWGYVALLRRLASEPTTRCTRRGSSGTWSSRWPAASRCRRRPAGGDRGQLPAAGRASRGGRSARPSTRSGTSTPTAAVRLERLVARHVAFGKESGAGPGLGRRVDEPNARLVERGPPGGRPRGRGRVTSAPGALEGHVLVADPELAAGTAVPAGERDLADAADHLRPADRVAGRG